MDLHIGLNLSAQKGQNSNWSIIHFWEAQLIFYKHCTQTMHEKDCLKVQQPGIFYNLKIAAQSNPTCGTELQGFCDLLQSCSPVCRLQISALSSDSPGVLKKMYVEMTKRLMKKSQKSQNKQNIIKKEKNKTSWLPVLHQLPLSPWCQRKISLTLVPFITSTQTSCKLPGTFPLTYSIWNPLLCFCALSRTKHTLSTKPMKSIPNFTRKFYMLLKPIPLHPRKEHPPVMQQKLPLVAQLDFKSGTHTHWLCSEICWYYI